MPIREGIARLPSDFTMEYLELSDDDDEIHDDVGLGIDELGRTESDRRTSINYNKLL